MYPSSDTLRFAEMRCLRSPRPLRLVDHAARVALREAGRRRDAQRAEVVELLLRGRVGARGLRGGLWRSALEVRPLGMLQARDAAALLRQLVRALVLLARHPFEARRMSELGQEAARLVVERLEVRRLDAVRARHLLD